MIDKLLRLAISVAVIVCSSPAISKSLNSVSMSFCDAGTKCKKCAETIAVTFEQDGKVVFMSGKGIDGKKIRETLSNCTFTSKSDWSCEEGRIRISSSSGKISAVYLREVLVSGVRQEVCITQ